MKYESKPFAVPASNASGAAMDVSDHTSKWVQVYGTFTADLQLEGRVSAAADWKAIGNVVNAPGFIQVSQELAQLRFTVSNFANGVPKAELGARNARTD